jgi:hypothetical protein
MARLETDERLQRALGALKPAAFGCVGLFDCPLCGGKQDLYVTVCIDNPNPNYLFNLACFCGCGPQKVAEKILDGKVRDGRMPRVSKRSADARRRARARHSPTGLESHEGRRGKDRPAQDLPNVISGQVLFSETPIKSAQLRC